MTLWLTVMAVYIVIGVIICCVRGRWLIEYLDGNDNRWLPYLVIVEAWPVLVLVMIADWFDRQSLTPRH